VIPLTTKDASAASWTAIPFEGANKWLYYIIHTIFDMKMMTLFSMLFGVGVMIYAEKIERGVPIDRVRWLWFKRMFILLCIGMVHAYFIWEGDILVSYAVCGIVFLWWLRRMPAWAMVLVAAVFVVLPQISWSFMGMSYHWFMDTSPPEWMKMPAEDLAEAQKRFAEFQKEMDPTPEQLETLVQTYRGSYGTNLAHRAKTSLMMQTMMIPIYMLWRGTGIMLLGAALYKWRIVTGERSTRFFTGFTLINYAIGLSLTVGGMVFNTHVNFSTGLLMAVGMPFNVFGSIPMAMGHMGLIVLLVKAMPTAWLVRALSAVGRMALTNYLMHSLIGSLIFYGYGFGYYGTMDRLEQEMIVLAVWVFQLIWSPMWLARYRFGPMEWLWRSLTYSKMQPMRRVA